MLGKNDLNEKQVATTGQGKIGMLPCYNEILKEKKSYIARIQCMNSRQLQGIMHRHLYCWTLDMREMTCLQFKMK
jgi:hypothetical protein